MHTAHFCIGATSLLTQGYPLRPELMESTFMLYEATGDDAYLRAGEALQARLQDRNRVECGFAGISDVTTGAGWGVSANLPCLTITLPG